MLDIQLLRNHPEVVRLGAKRKGIEVPIDDFLAVDTQWREQLAQLEKIRSELNAVSKSIGACMAKGDNTAAEEAKKHAKYLKEKIDQHEDQVRGLEKTRSELELQFPNLPHSSVPDGENANHNIEVAIHGNPPDFNFAPKPHWQIGEDLGILDFQGGSKVTGSGFIFYRNLGARLQRALFNFMIDYQTLHNGYSEVYPPYLVNRSSLVGTGQLPKFELDQYHIERDDLFLIPTAEVPVTNLHREEIIEYFELPKFYAAFSGCFRREAGAAGRDTRGLLRVHQFDKVELVIICEPDKSYDLLEKIRADAESVLKALDLHYRVVELCAGELSFSNTKCYDLEVWAPGIQQWLEISSASNFEDFQARRAEIRYRPAQGEKPRYVHTLNASGVALPRLMAAILESYQQPGGSVIIPEKLRPYIGVDSIE